MSANINYKPETCGNCGGDGGYQGLCKPCGGQGSVLVAQPARKCGNCGGDGGYQGLCKPCNGTGWAHAIR